MINSILKRNNSSEGVLRLGQDKDVSYNFRGVEKVDAEGRQSKRDLVDRRVKQQVHMAQSVSLRGKGDEEYSVAAGQIVGHRR